MRHDIGAKHILPGDMDPSVEIAALKEKAQRRSCRAAATVP